MGKMKISNLDDYEDLDDKYGGHEKITKKNGKFKKNNDEAYVHEPQRLPAGWREGDSYIGLRKKARN